MTPPSPCLAVTQPGTLVTLHFGGAPAVTRARPGDDLVCTQDAGHGGNHSACDARGHILARWPRRGTERYWQPS